MKNNFFFKTCVILLTLFFSGAVAQEKKDASGTLFLKPQVLRLKIEIPPHEVELIKAEHRPYVRGTLLENDTTLYPSVGFKLKGAAGSFREFEDRPCLTLNMDKFKKKQSFYGLDKFHLNNSVQDESYLNELLCSELFQTAGCPTPRVAYARVYLNGRDLGLYVFKEAFDSKFLKRHFEKAKGNLYDSGFLQDIDAPLEKDEGEGPDDLRDLRALLEARQEPDPKIREIRLAERLDMDAFLTFMALERMMCHWDGYCLNKNNYRLYFDPGRSGKAIFMPHGMDQMFQEPEMDIHSHPDSLVASAVMQSNELRKRYREKIQELLPLFSLEKLLTRIDEITPILKIALAEISEEAVTLHHERVQELRERIQARIENLRNQVGKPEPEPESFDENGVLTLSNWYPVSEVEDAKQEEMTLPRKKRGYLIQVGPSKECVASWRRRILLKTGTYRFLAQVQGFGVLPLEETEGSAAGIRISRSERQNQIKGTTVPTTLTFEFTIREDRKEVELVAELRAKRGKVIFFQDSLQLIRLMD